MPFYSNIDIAINVGMHRSPSGVAVLANPTRGVSFGDTDGAEVTLHEITSPIWLVGLGNNLLKARVVASGASGTIDVTWRMYVDDVLVATETTSTGFGSNNEADLYPATNTVFLGSLYAPKWKVTTQVTVNTIDAGTSNLSYDDASTGQLSYHPVVGG